MAEWPWAGLSSVLSLFSFPCETHQKGGVSQPPSSLLEAEKGSGNSPE